MNYNLGRVYNYISKHQEAMKYLKEGLSSENDNLLMKTYYTLSDFYYFEGAIDSAIYFLEKSYPLAKKQMTCFL